MKTATVIALMLAAFILLSEPVDSDVHIGPCTRANMKQPALLGQEIWQCDQHGNYMPLQCHPTSGYCCCVEPRSGKCIKDTEKAPGAGLPQC
ncbi:nidogen-2-like [Varroa jacobsoni]|uniref:Thyroglobulin type-1 domain-containing protein n=1 Tax=Varroa destructor TaxID=109461 RepID=A0A7M7J6K2_VARDE|nr:nidogen-2-like [Varroa destructor]XP_022695364.1 nidogen-2-like [Varroa jacobsoni]